MTLQYKICHFLYEFSKHPVINDSLLPVVLYKVESLVNEIAMYLTDDESIKILSSAHKNYMLKYLKTDLSSMISPDLIKSVFVEYESYICNNYQCDFPEIVSENEEFKNNSLTLAYIVVSFNNLEYRNGD
ncbi:hypothetical protein RF11_12091 [Thelohanellus kitauei]|uniref:Uncharacterized protein n=1 Tax=Thelohanellus kitauei TaxID=669202 RepID=A0A0C2NBG1_THEKT|nr:hypothetical protein RF11_12091 [Thelohanellus kitauei]